MRRHRLPALQAPVVLAASLRHRLRILGRWRLRRRPGVSSRAIAHTGCAQVHGISRWATAHLLIKLLRLALPVAGWRILLLLRRIALLCDVQNSVNRRASGWRLHDGMRCSEHAARSAQALSALSRVTEARLTMVSEPQCDRRPHIFLQQRRWTLRTWGAAVRLGDARCG